MRSTILAIVLIVAAGAAHARASGTVHAPPIPDLAGNAGRMPETVSSGFQPPPSMPTPQYTSPSQSLPIRMGHYSHGGMFHGAR
jgi:hypothetical protein